MSNVPKLRFKEFSGEWEENKLLNIGRIVTGNTPSTHILEYYNGDKFFVSPSDINTNRFINSTKTTLTELGFSKGRKVEKYSVCFVCIGSTIGKVSQLSKDSITNQQINCITANKNNLNDFIYSLLEKSAPKIKLIAGVQAVPQINKTDFSKLKFMFPQKQEQEKIASFLTSVDTKIEQLTRKEELLQQYKKGVMQKIFSQEIRFFPKGTSSQAQGEDKRSDYSDWEEKKFGEIFYFLRGSSLSKSDINVKGKNKCIHYGELFTIYKEQIFFVKSTTNLESGQFSKRGDILMPSSDVTPQGLATASTVMEDNVIIGGDTNILRPKNNLDSIFISYFLNTNKNEIMKLVTGTTIKHIYNKDIAKLKINLPCLEEQTKIANFLSSIDTKISQNRKALEVTKKFKKALLQQMFV